MRHGQGSLKKPDGTTYEGLFINNLLQGMVKVTSATGEVTMVNFVSGNPMS
jgi:hypothetical protein